MSPPSLGMGLPVSTWVLHPLSSHTPCLQPPSPPPGYLLGFPKPSGHSLTPWNVAISERGSEILPVPTENMSVVSSDGPGRAGGGGGCTRSLFDGRVCSVCVKDEGVLRGQSLACFVAPRYFTAVFCTEADRRRKCLSLVSVTALSLSSCFTAIHPTVPM